MLEVTLYPIHNAFTFVKFNVKLMADEEIDGKKEREGEQQRWRERGWMKRESEENHKLLGPSERF